MNKKGINTVVEELKQRMIAKSAKIKRYDQRINQFRQNRIFSVDQNKIYKELNGSEAGTNEYQMLRRVEGFGVIFGQWRRNITIVRSGCLS